MRNAKLAGENHRHSTSGTDAPPSSHCTRAAARVARRTASHSTRTPTQQQQQASRTLVAQHFTPPSNRRTLCSLAQHLRTFLPPPASHKPSHPRTNHTRSHHLVARTARLAFVARIARTHFRSFASSQHFAPSNTPPLRTRRRANPVATRSHNTPSKATREKDREERTARERKGEEREER